MNPDPYKSVYDRFCKLEQTHGLLSWQPSGVFAWAAIRAELFEKILVATGTTAAFQSTQPLKWSRVRALPGMLLLRNPYLGWHKTPHLVVKWSRLRAMPDGTMHEALSSELVRRLPPEDVMALDLFGQVSDAGPMTWNMDAISLLTGAVKRVSNVRLSDADVKFLQTVEQAIVDNFDCNIGLTERFSGYIRDFRVRVWLLKRLMRKRKVRQVFVIVAYGHAPLIAAAQELNIPVIEYQHGIIHHAHAGYDFPPGSKVAYRPDHLLLFGEHWKAAARHYFDTQLHVIGAPHITSVLKDWKDTTKEPVLLFLSQPSISEQLLLFAVEAARSRDNLKVVYRLHPGEDYAKVKATLSRWPDVADKLELSQGGGGVETLRMQAQARYQVGVYSTAVIEGVELGCHTFIASLAGCSALQSLVEDGMAELVSEPKDLVNRLTATMGIEDSNIHQHQTDVLVDATDLDITDFAVSSRP